MIAEARRNGFVSNTTFTGYAAAREGVDYCHIVQLNATAVVPRWLACDQWADDQNSCFRVLENTGNLERSKSRERLAQARLVSQ
jgi:hypothetical protein